MDKVVILGQAPSRVGDGRPFSGPSGARLCSLAGLRNYDELADQFHLMNLFDDPVPKTVGKGDEFDLADARLEWQRIKHQFGSGFRILSCGRGVSRAMGLHQRTRYLVWTPLRTRPAIFGEVALFPHPSGISHYWNDPENVRKAAAFLAPLTHRARTAQALR